MLIKDDKINIKLELFKDRFSNKFSILTHFNQNAPNIQKDDEGFIWVPTIEERDLINDAFKLLSLDDYFNKIKTSPQTIEDTEKLIQPSQTESKNKQEISENNSSIKKEKATYNIRKNEIKTENDSRNESSYFESINKSPFEKKNKNQEINDKNIEENKFFEIDENSIEKELSTKGNKHDTKLDDEEQTIVDRVLNQKKKEKWSKR